MHRAGPLHGVAFCDGRLNPGMPGVVVLGVVVLGVVMARVDEVTGAGLEPGLAVAGAEVEPLTVVLGRERGPVRVDVHAADRVLHDLSGACGVVVGVTGHDTYGTSDT